MHLISILISPCVDAIIATSFTCKVNMKNILTGTATLFRNNSIIPVEVIVINATVAMYSLNESVRHLKITFRTLSFSASIPKSFCLSSIALVWSFLILFMYFHLISKRTHCVKSVQIWSFFRSECGKIRTSKNSVFGHFSRSDWYYTSKKY